MKKILVLLLALMLLFPVVTLRADATEGECGETEELNIEVTVPEMSEETEPETEASAQIADSLSTEEAEEGEQPASAQDTESPAQPEPASEEPAADAPASVPADEPAQELAEPTAEPRSEELAEMEAALPQELSEDYREALCAVALSQLDYEGPAGFIRYTDWCLRYAPEDAAEELEAGQLAELREAWQAVAPEDPWDAHFVAFCLHYAGVPMQAYPTAELWAEALGEQLLTEAAPQPGDLIFLALNEEEPEDQTEEKPSEEAKEEAEPSPADHVAILVAVDEDGGLWAVFGDGSVRQELLDPESIVGYAALPEREEEPEETVQSRPPLRFNADVHALSPQGYRLLRVKDDLPEDESYCFDGLPLRLTYAAGYCFDGDDTAAFVAFIPDSYSLEEVAALLTAEPVPRQTLEYSADVNEDGVVNIADANAVYQMIQNGADYYTEDQISTDARLRLCYSDLRDLAAILDIINGNTED